MRIFLKKTKHNLSDEGSASIPRLPPGAGGSAPRPTWFYSHLLLQLCRVCF